MSAILCDFKRVGRELVEWEFKKKIEKENFYLGCFALFCLWSWLGVQEHISIFICSDDHFVLIDNTFRYIYLLVQSAAYSILMAIIDF